MRQILTAVFALTLVGSVASLFVPPVSSAPPACLGRTATIAGDPDGDGVIRGTEGNDVIVGTVNFEAIYGLGGNDRICGSPAGAVLLADGDRIFAGPGDDRVKAGGAGDEIYGEDGVDTITGGLAADLVRGGEGNDTDRRRRQQRRALRRWRPGHRPRWEWHRRRRRRDGGRHAQRRTRPRPPERRR